MQFGLPSFDNAQYRLNPVAKISKKEAWFSVPKVSLQSATKVITYDQGAPELPLSH
jgi:hypothetical protein